MRNRKNSKIIIESKSYIFQLFSKNSSYFKITFYLLEIIILILLVFFNQRKSYFNFLLISDLTNFKGTKEKNGKIKKVCFIDNFMVCIFLY